MITNEGDVKSYKKNNNRTGVQLFNQVQNDSIGATANKSLKISELNALAILFNNGQLVESEKVAIELTQQYPKNGFSWKVLGAILQKRGLFEEALNALRNAATLLPKDSEAHYNLGNYYYDQLDLGEAVKCYQKAIKLSPNFFQAHYNLGNVLKSQKNFEQAKVSYKKALRIEQNSLEVLCNLAQVHYEQESFNESINYFKQALFIKEDFVAAHVGLGACFQALEQLAQSENCYMTALSYNPNNVDAYNNLGMVFKKLGRLKEAESCYRTLLSLTPEDAYAYIQLGSLLKSIGETAESIEFFVQAININPQVVEVQNTLGLALADDGRYSEAKVCYQKAIEIRPDFWEAYNNLGLTLHRMECFAEAEVAFETAIELNPSEAQIYSNFSLPLLGQGQIKKAEACLKKAIEINPKYVKAYINLGTNYLAQGMEQAAEFAFLEALKLDESSTDAKSNQLFTLNYSGRHTSEYRLEQASQFGQIADDKVNFVFTSWPHVHNVKRLKIGLVSGDLRQHPVAFFLENWAKNTDSSRIELIAYTTDIRQDDVTARLKPHFSSLKSLVGLNDEAAAELIYKDGIHILIDLSGHTAGNRLPVFAYRPAPLQVSWLGYFATTGMSSIDYFIADEVGVPEQNKTQFVETVKYLPYTRLCFSAPSALIETSPLPALANGYITFASFQTLVKASDDVLAIWAEVMHALPNSKLRWQCKSFADLTVVNDIQDRFAKYGVDSKRLILLGSVSRNAYFKAQADVDMILDTFPFPGGTTTCEALWMGVPTLTLIGDTLIARQGASLMTAAGLSEWIVENKADYVKKALSFASDINYLSQLRMKLRDQVLLSPLFDAPKFARNMEKVLLEIWEEKSPFLLKHKLKQNITITESENLDSINQELRDAVSEVFQLALDHQNAGQLMQAEQLYLEILNIQTQHADASHNLGVIEIGSKGAVLALPRFELAVQWQPENEKFWVSYIQTLMQTGNIETATNALEYGQKYGLSSKIAQIMANEFYKELEKQ